MIVREFVDNQDMPFDYFNDYTNTFYWLSNMSREEGDKYQKAAEKLDKDYKKYLKEG